LAGDGFALELSTRGTLSALPTTAAYFLRTFENAEVLATGKEKKENGGVY
jgi:hypothetical protein